MSCHPVEVEVEQDEFQLDTLAFGLCFLFGLLIGAGLLLCIGWFCIKDIKSRQVSAKRWMRMKSIYIRVKHLKKNGVPKHIVRIFMKI